eukprot:TRINITY_DN49347_c0_g1_i1.p1 TRINITY_DN49347_c0_g1~~TRINITY_DN49347_c0_g1_i1.p1  ORF type:complete len:293 (-),score=32.95 TRINITY_DN49347_c0_g1_i1:280-1053(-)
MAKLSTQAYDNVNVFEKVALGTVQCIPTLGSIMNIDYSTPGYKPASYNGGPFDVIDVMTGSTGLDYTIFKNSDSTDIVLAFRGTEPLSIVDWINDGDQLLGLSRQYSAAVALARKLKGMMKPGQQLTFTGHSLGGGLACAAALATMCNAFCFDASGIAAATFERLELNDDAASLIYQFQIQDDFVDVLNHGVSSGLARSKQYGSVFRLQNISDKIPFSGWSKWIPLIGDKIAVYNNAVINHAPMVVLHQLENKMFVA